MKMFPHPQIVCAYTRWRPGKATGAGFWDYIGEPERAIYHHENDSWLVCDEAARKIEMLLSPHWKTLLKAYEIRHESKP